MRMMKIIGISLIILISNYSFSCYSSQQVASEETLIYEGEKIASVITKDGRAIKFYADSGRYNPKERVIAGDTIISGQSSVPYHGGPVIPIKVSLDDVMWVNIVKYRGKTISATAFIILLSATAIFGLILYAYFDAFAEGFGV